MSCGEKVRVSQYTVGTWVMWRQDYLDTLEMSPDFHPAVERARELKVRQISALVQHTGDK